MADETTNIHRKGEVTSTVESLPEGKGASNVGTTDIPEPFTAYKGDAQLFVVDHFGLGDNWNLAVGGYPREIESITNYLKGLVQSGELADNQEAIKDKLEGMIKVNNLGKEPRASIRLPVLASYAKFLMETRIYATR